MNDADEALTMAGLEHLDSLGEIQATHGTVVDSPDGIRLVLAVGDEPITRLVLGPADALALACDLLAAARRRFGR